MVHSAPTIYNGRSWTRRTPNRDGFLDVDHAREKPAGVTRIGFFGDSYVEALQVRLEDTFFRRLPSQISGKTIEAFGFGISGWGTLHSLMAYRVMGPRYALDDVVYLFELNDPGDHHYQVRSVPRPLAGLSEDGTDFILRIPAEGGGSRSLRIRRFLERRLLLARLIRVQLGRLHTNWEGRPAEVAGRVPRVPNQNDPPSTWPPALLEDARRLTRLILKRFRDEVVGDGRRFAVLYVPRAAQELDGTLPPADSWFPWLSQTCAELGIRLLDPSALLSTQQAAGTTIYADHWTSAGHELIAAFLTRALADTVPAE